MKNYRVNINGKEVLGVPGQTILDLARQEDIFIPTLCYDERTKIYGSCGLCMCEIEGNPKLCKACATEIEDGMVILTNTERVIESRKTNLELLLSNHRGDCRPPCVKACPAETDCQGYVGLVANGEFEAGIKLVKDKIPLPASLGRVCPHPCESDCRRGLVDEPIAIMWLKRFLSDMDFEGEEYLPEVDAETGKSVAIVGAGPMGLSAAYFLRKMGHDVTIFEYMPYAGGMLRYGIPEYRLPKMMLDREIRTIEKMGVNIITGVRVGQDIKFSSLTEDYDAVLLAIGAWKSTGVGFKGEDSQGVIGGIDFLRKVVRNEPQSIGKSVAIVGGGNTAMDACRTAVRLGAEKVYNVYRRTKEEMPADMIEIEEAEEEGVIFKNLTNPIEAITDENGRVKELVLQVMELGEPDESGRRRPVEVPGKTETIQVDTVILAIGQAVDTEMLDGEIEGKIEKTKKGAIKYDSQTFRTSMEKVFAGGDCGNDKISIAVEAIADAKKAANIIDAYLYGVDTQYREEYIVTRDDITAADFEDRERQCRPQMEHLSPEERADNFSEVVLGYTPEEAMEEAKRCLECGCHDYYECKLVDYANQYDVKPERFGGDKKTVEVEDDHPFIVRDPNKCILCGLCVRVCDEVMGVGALGLVDRGFETVVMPAMGGTLLEAGCISCGQCVSVCPVGALQERQTVAKEVPVPTEGTERTCMYCSVGCSFLVETAGEMVTKANPDKAGVVNKGLCCGKGKWGFDCGEEKDDFISWPMMAGEEGLRYADYNDAVMLAAKKAQSLVMKYGKDAVAVAVSDRYTNEEIYAIKKMADVMGVDCFSFNNRENGLKKVVGYDHTPNDMEELISTDFILMMGYEFSMNPVVQLKIKQASERGAKVIAIMPEGSKPVNLDFADKVVYVKNNMEFLNKLASHLATKADSKLKGYEELVKSLAGVTPCEEAVAVAEEYLKAKKAMIVYQQNKLSVEAAAMVGNIALLSGHLGKARDGILMLKAKNNSQGLVDLGITAGAEKLAGLKGLFIFGENPKGVDLSDLEFLMVSDLRLTEVALAADLVVPCGNPLATRGTYTNTERRLMAVEAAKSEGTFSTWSVAADIAKAFEVDFNWEDESDIEAEMCDTVPWYQRAFIGEIIADSEKFKPELAVVSGNSFADPIMTTDPLMQDIQSRIPKPKM